MSWNLEQLAELAVKRHGAKQKDLLQPLLNSVGRKFEIARYHSIESNRLIDQYFESDKFENYNKALRFIFDRKNGDDEAVKFFKDAFIAEANIVAYSQSIHSSYDILGQIIIKALNIAHLFAPKQNIYLYTVKNKLINTNIAHDIVTQIESATNCEAYRYLRAFVNTNKHLCLVSMPHTVGMSAEEETSHGIRIDSFIYDDENFPQRWARDFVTKDFIELSEGIVRVGNAINYCLQ